jgi:hypothetical protein
MDEHRSTWLPTYSKNVGDVRVGEEGVIERVGHDAGRGKILPLHI